jgi:Mg-chelatase subunit ChlD
MSQPDSGTAPHGSPQPSPTSLSTRWQLVLGAPSSSPQMVVGSEPLDNHEGAQIARALDFLYGPSERSRAGADRPSVSNVAAWLGDIRLYFPVDSTKLLQYDALARPDWTDPLLTLGQEVLPSAELAATILRLSRRLPTRTRETAREVVRQLVESLAAQLTPPLLDAVHQSQRQARTHPPRRAAEIDWPRTLLANLRHYSPAHQRLLPVRFVGRASRRRAWRQVVLCLDQSGSMIPSTVYAGIYAAALATLPALQTHVVAFDTEVVDLSAQCQDPLQLLFSLPLGGATDLQRALDYCHQLITSPQEAVLLLISDLHHAPSLGQSPSTDPLLASAARLVSRGVTVVTLLALDDLGTPNYNLALAEAFANLGIPAIAAPPDQFPPLLAAALTRSLPH